MTREIAIIAGLVAAVCMFVVAVCVKSCVRAEHVQTCIEDNPEAKEFFMDCSVYSDNCNWKTEKIFCRDEQ